MSIINNIGLVNADLDLNLDLDKRVYRRRYESRRSSNLKLYFKKNKKMAKNAFQYGGRNSYTLQCGTIMTLISPREMHPAMWHVALGT